MATATVVPDDRTEKNGNYPLRFPTAADFAAPRTIITDAVPWLDALGSKPYFLSVIDMSKTHVPRADWLGRFHAYYGTDHGLDSVGTGGSVAFTNNIKTGTWSHWDDGDTVLFSDPIHGNGYTGAFSVFYDAFTETFYAQWHNKGTAGSATEVYYATSPDGITFTYVGKWLDAEHPWVGTGRHNSYGRPHALGNGQAIQIHNLGGAAYTHNTVARCYDLTSGEWYGDGKVLSFDDKERMTGVDRYSVLAPSRVVVVDGQQWLIHTQRELSPVLFARAQIIATPWKADWSGPAGMSRVIVDYDNDTDDEFGAAYPEAIVVDDELHVFYSGFLSAGQYSDHVRHTWASLRASR